MITLQTPSDFQECGLQNFDKETDVLIVAPEVNVAEDVLTIRIKGLRKPVILTTVYKNTATTGTSMHEDWLKAMGEDDYLYMV